MEKIAESQKKRQKFEGLKKEGTNETGQENRSCKRMSGDNIGQFPLHYGYTIYLIIFFLTSEILTD